MKISYWHRRDEAPALDEVCWAKLKGEVISDRCCMAKLIDGKWKSWPEEKDIDCLVEFWRTANYEHPTDPDDQDIPTQR